jgi:hypothetical protein
MALAVALAGRPNAMLDVRVVDAAGGVARACVATKAGRALGETDATGRIRATQLRQPGTRLTAWKSGYYIGGAVPWGRRHIEIRLAPLPAGDHASYEWLDPNPDPAGEHNCANCHVEMYRQWSASAHARSALNRQFLDLFYGTDAQGRRGVGWSFVADQPEARGVCAACHVPSIDITDPAADDPRRATGVVREGIHCDFCHKIEDAVASHLGTDHGRYALKLRRPPPGQQVFFGPLRDVDRGFDTYAPLYESSLYCASCHEGVLFGTRAYTTYSEWLATDYARRGVQCQDCHMRPDGRTRNIAPGHGGIDRDPTTLSTHHFPGGADAAYLRACADLDLAAEAHAESLGVTVAIRPQGVGHRLPTGSADRHLILVVSARDAKGRPLAQSAGPRVHELGGADYAGQPGRLFGRVLVGPDGYRPAPFWNALGEEFDCRLYSDQTERLSVVFSTVGARRPLAVRARLLYRRFYDAVRREKGWPAGDIELIERHVSVND